MERVTDARIRIDVADGEWANLSWTELCEGTHKAIVELARRNPQARVVVKTKAHSRRVDDILTFLRPVRAANCRPICPSFPAAIPSR